MVRVTRFSFDEGMNVNEPVPEDLLDDEFDDVVAGDDRPVRAPGTSRRRKKRGDPADRRTDRRHLAGEWGHPDKPEDRPEQSGQARE